MVMFWKKRKIAELQKGAWEFLQKKYHQPPVEKGSEKAKDSQKTETTIRYSLSLPDDSADSRLNVRYSLSGSDPAGIRYSKKEGKFSQETVDARVDGTIKKVSLDKICEEIENGMELTFVDKMLKYINKRGLRDSAVYKAAQIDRRLFSKIASDREYKPAKDTCIAIAIALQLNLHDTKDILERAGYTLSRSSKRDVILEYLIREKVYNINDVNEILYRLEQKTLGR